MGVGVVLAIMASGCGSDSGGGGAGAATGGALGMSGAGGFPLGAGGGAPGGGGAAGGGGDTIATGGSTLGAGGSMLGAGGGTPGTDNTAKTGGVGKPCDSTADCTAPLTCHQDTSTYIGDQQCSTSCNSDADCTSLFSQYSMCIGAHICVTKCIVDSDCPAKTRCIDAGWCERTGPGSGIPYCTGSPTPCSLLTETQCFGSLGCTSNLGTCGGLADDCYAQFDDVSCYGVSGCFWDSSSSTCSGSADPCSLMAGQGSCTLQPGCYWTPGSCTGVAETCDSVPVSLCTAQTGCTVSQ